MILDCAQCGATFTPRRAWQKFCSDRCRYLAHVEKEKHGPKEPPIDRSSKVNKGRDLSIEEQLELIGD